VDLDALLHGVSRNFKIPTAATGCTIDVVYLCNIVGIQQAKVNTLSVIVKSRQFFQLFLQILIVTLKILSKYIKRYDY